MARHATKSTRDIDIPEVAKPLSSWKCRKCLRTRKLSEYYITTNKEWDTSGHYSICRFCVDDALERYLVSEKSLDKAILKICKVVNCKFDSRAVETTKKEIETIELKGKVVSGKFGIYRKNLTKVHGVGVDPGDLTYSEAIIYNNPRINPDEYDDGVILRLEEFWGNGFSPEDYQFLEDRLAEWKSSYSCQTKAEEFYMKEACHKELDLRKARTGDSSSGVDSITKSMNELLKAAALTPAQTSAANSGKMQDSWGTIIKKIEETTPSEYYRDKQLFQDFDNIGLYIKNYIVRSLKNFILGSKDFNIVDDENDFDDYGEVIENGNESPPVSV